MVSRKINTDAIDENLLIASIGKSKIGTTTASILNGASQSQVKDTEEKEICHRDWSMTPRLLFSENCNTVSCNTCD